MISLKIVTPRGIYLQEEIKSLHAKSVGGEFTLLPNHMPVVMAMVPCRLVLTTDKDQKQEYALAGGFLHFDDNKASLMTDAIERSDEIDIDRAKAAYKRARERLDHQDVDLEMKKAERALHRAINRLDVSGKKFD
ncbi:MAG: ATP synthase F1 subunit epsilon [Ileibacterium sp.]|nr:ATP synthase F1 subunit epsilon [Ileibacterium sp.]